LDIARSAEAEAEKTLARVKDDLYAARSAASKDTASGAEALASAQAAHALEISDLQAKVRQLESSSHAASSRAHDLARQLADMTAANAELQRGAGAAGAAGGAAGLFISPVDRPHSPSPPSSPRWRERPLDAGLPASVRHKRQVSLNALKARMGPHLPRRGSLLRLDSVSESGSGRSSPVLDAPARRQQQFGDEIMYCCSACEGDLVTL
jgi:hypothetical protein